MPVWLWWEIQITSLGWGVSMKRLEVNVMKRDVDLKLTTGKKGPSTDPQWVMQLWSRHSKIKLTWKSLNYTDDNKLNYSPELSLLVMISAFCVQSFKSPHFVSFFSWVINVSSFLFHQNYVTLPMMWAYSYGDCAWFPNCIGVHVFHEVVKVCFKDKTTNSTQ